jgi:hypothetical protein
VPVIGWPVAKRCTTKTTPLATMPHIDARNTLPAARCSGEPFFVKPPVQNEASAATPSAMWAKRTSEYSSMA